MEVFGIKTAVNGHYLTYTEEEGLDFTPELNSKVVALDDKDVVRQIKTQLESDTGLTLKIWKARRKENMEE